MRAATVEARIIDAGGVTLIAEHAMTSGTGSFGGFQCPLPGEHSEITALTSHTRFNVIETRPGAGDSPLTLGPSACNSTVPYVLQSDGAALYQRMLTTTDNELSLFGKVLSGLPVKIISATLGAYDRNGPSGPEIRMPAPTIGALTDGNPYSNRFVPAHEAGRAFLDRTFQNGDQGYGNCPMIHFVGDTTNIRCAYSEGFADWHTILTLPAAADVFDFEGTNYAATLPGKGPLIEGAAASYLVDMTDAVRAVETDALALSVSFVGSVIERCEHNRPRHGDGADDIRDFRFCFENRAAAGSMRFYPSSPNFVQPTWSLANMSQDYVWNIDGIH